MTRLALHVENTERTPAMTPTANPLDAAGLARILTAELSVREAYDRARARRPFDTAAGRRRRALERIDDAVRDARRQAGRDTDTTTRADLERAYAALVAGLLRRETTDAVLGALVDVGLELELARPERLDRALNGDGRFTIYPAGASRARR